MKSLFTKIVNKIVPRKEQEAPQKYEEFEAKSVELGPRNNSSFSMKKESTSLPKLAKNNQEENLILPSEINIEESTKEDSEELKEIDTHNAQIFGGRVGR